jgi:hypothetical protein
MNDVTSLKWTTTAEFVRGPGNYRAGDYLIKGRVRPCASGTHKKAQW